MISKIYLRFSLSLILIVSMLAISLPRAISSQTNSAQTESSTDLQAQLATIERNIDARRTELGIPGLSVAIVKDDQVIYLKGLGYKNFEKQIAVTPDTQFAIGSTTKAFTSLSVLMSQDEGKLSLDDSPKKYLPYFKINDADTDKNITIRDLLSHSSGLNRTDLAMITGKLNREELIRVAGEAKPTAKLREKFQYQNIMFTAAGEIVARVQKQAWEKFIPERIFKPLGMMNTSVSVAEMHKAKDYSFGYDYNFDTKETRNLPTLDILQVAPAGSINSSARDMSQWLRFILNKGELNGKRLVSEKSFEEWFKPQMKVAGTTSYGLGWFLRDWKGIKVADHGGNIEGFNAYVSVMPEKKIGLVILTNVSASPLPAQTASMIYETLLGNPQTIEAKTDAATLAASNADKLPLEKLVGKYYFKETGFLTEIVSKNGKLVMLVPAQPEYTLETVEGNKYKMSPLPAGFFVTFQPSATKAGEIELVSEQPGRKFTMARATAEDLSAISKRIESYKDLAGEYKSNDDANSKAAIAISETALTVQITGQPPLALIEKESDVFGLNGFPATYRVKIKRDAANKIVAIIFAQPEGEFEYKRVAATAVSNAPKMTVEGLMPKVINALGGEANWKKLTTRQMKYEVDFVNQGVKGAGTSYAKAPNLSANEGTINALGKQIADSFDYFDGTNGGDFTSFAPGEIYTGRRLEDVKLESDFYGILNWKINLKSAEITKTETVDGEDAYVVVFHPETATEYTYYISAKSFLPVRKLTLYVSGTSGAKLPFMQILTDYRLVDGVMIPFKSTTLHPSMGDIVTYIREVKHNVAIDDAMFKPREKKASAQK